MEGIFVAMSKIVEFCPKFANSAPEQGISREFSKTLGACRKENA
jgi:hypothetical protein